jgi:hypothetical protein
MQPRDIRNLYLAKELAPDGKPVIVMPIGYIPARVRWAKHYYSKGYSYHEPQPTHRTSQGVARVPR